MTPHNGHPLPSPNRTTTVGRNEPRPPTRPVKKKKGGSFWLCALLFLVILALVVGFVLFRRMHAQSELKRNTQQMALPTVLIVQPEKGDSTIHLTLPGSVQAYTLSTLYAQVTGYLKSWYVDIGGHVTKGELLAEVETPETDQQLQSSRASQVQTQASVDLAQITANRYNNLLPTRAVSQQDADQYNGDLAVAQANLAAAQANVRRLEKTEAFKNVYAPFDGILTQRRVDTGDLVTAGNGSASQELFQVAQTDVLRVYVNVPELYAEEMAIGLPCHLEMASNPSQPVMGTLVRTSKAIDPTSLTLLVEVDVQNQDGKLLPGGFAQVRFDLTLPHPPVVLPGNTLIFRAQGTQVGVVDANNVVHLKDIKVGRDFGTKIEVINGVGANDQVILNPSDSVTDGQKVQIKKEKAKPDSADATAKQS